MPKSVSGSIKGSMVEGNPTKPLIGFALPMVAGNLFQQFYNIIDSIIVGNVVGEDALAAVGASTAITMLFVMVAIGTGIGCSVVISQLFGAGQLEKMKTAISTALLSVLGFSIFLSVLGVAINQPIMHLMGTPENIFADAAEYMQIYFLGFVFLFLYNAFSAIFNALGDSKKPLLFLAFSSLLNIGLDLYFVARLHMGVAGVAWATLIAQGISAVLSFGFLMHKLKGIATESYRRFDKGLLKNMIKVAIPTIVQQSIVSVGMLLIQSAVNRFGSTFLAGYTAATKIDSIAIVPMVAVGNAASTYVAQNMGAKKPERKPDCGPVSGCRLQRRSNPHWHRILEYGFPVLFYDGADEREQRHTPRRCGHGLVPKLQPLQPSCQGIADLCAGRCHRRDDHHVGKPGRLARRPYHCRHPLSPGGMEGKEYPMMDKGCRGFRLPVHES